MSEPLTLGILGANSWIANAAVIPAINECPNAILGASGARSGPIGYLDVLSDPDVDAVYIALANGDHLEWVERAAEAGKHVLCEKPLAISSSDARRMFEACDAAGVLLAEAYMTPFHPLSIALAALIDNEDLGVGDYHEDEVEDVPRVFEVAAHGEADPLDEHLDRVDADEGVADVGLRVLERAHLRSG